MKRLYGSVLLSSLAILALLVTPAFAAQDGTVVASAVAVPAQVTHLGFLISGIVKDVNVKGGDTVQAGDALVVLNIPELEYNVVAAQEALRSAEKNAELQRYKRVRVIRNGRKFWDIVPPEVRQIADAQAASAQALLDIAQANLAQATLLAPAGATVASVDILPGEYVSQNQALVTLAALDALQLETTDLSERDITRVKVGAPVDISIQALNESFRGKVIRISPMASTVGGDVVFKVTIGFDQQPEGLRWGMSAEVAIED